MNEKIERAMERFIDWPVFEHRFNHSGAMNATQLSDRDWFLKLKREAHEALATIRAVLVEKVDFKYWGTITWPDSRDDIDNLLRAALTYRQSLEGKEAPDER